MLGITHMVISATAVSLILQTADANLLMVGAIASLLPDVDTSRSPAGQVLRFVSKRLERQFPHRSCTHSLIASGVLALATYLPAIWLHFPLSVVHALSIGYFFGYFAGACTATGCELFWPSSFRCVWPGNRNFRLKTSSPVEYGVLVVLIFLLLNLIHINANGGIMTQLNRLIGTPYGVEQFYNKHASSQLIIAHIKGVRASDRAPISDDFVIIDSRGKDFIVESRTGEIYKTGSGPDLQLLNDYITAEAGHPAVTRIESLSLEEDQIWPKLERFNHAGAMVFISGKLKVEDLEYVHIPEETEQFQTMKKSGDRVIFDHTPLIVVQQKLGEEFATGELSIKLIYTKTTSTLGS